MKRRIVDILAGCFFGLWALVIFIYGVNSLIGLITGDIYLPDKKGHGSTLHGAQARIASCIVFVICAFILSTMFRAWRKKRRMHRGMDG